MPYDPLACAVVIIVLSALVVVAVFLRFYVRFYLLNNISTDDYLAAAAALVYTGLASSYIIGLLSYGVGRHASEVSEEDYVNGLKTVFIGELLYFVTTYLVKLSFIFTLFRIITIPSHRLTLYILAGTGFVVTTFTFFWAVFMCDPVSYFWTQGKEFTSSPIAGNKSIIGAHGSCKPITALIAVALVHAAWTLIADITLGLVLPTIILWSSQMRIRVKLSVGVLLGLGSVAALATIVRIVYLPQISLAENLFRNNPIVLWSTIESALGVIATAGSTWKPLIKGDSFGSSGGSSSSVRYPRSRTFRNSRMGTGTGMDGSRSWYDGGGGGGGGGASGGRRLGSLTEEDEGILLDGVEMGMFVPRGVP
ncbi:hypothetical protein BJY01DRAFT_248383 [Aspergillus pseudoustus]|uniref:Rhodopsin domain-containing protein n=1 Tax=Aspergillus pseudoustus TaxID=1810923 RepID=A0ABR4JV37_9EURO